MSAVLLGYPAAVLMGLTLGLIGGGGSILTVPILVYIFGVSAWDSTTYSLAIVGITALWGSLNAYRNAEIDLYKGFVFGVPSLIGVYIVRAGLMPQIPDQIGIGSYLLSRDSLVLGVFSLLMLVASWSMLRKSKFATNEGDNEAFSKQKSFLLLIEGLIVGGITGFVGAGGGFLIIPALIHLGKMPMRLAVGTSLMIISMKSLLGLLSDIPMLYTLNYSLLIPITLLSLFGMFFGARLRKHVPQEKLKKAFGGFVLISGTLIFLKEIL